MVPVSLEDVPSHSSGVAMADAWDFFGRSMGRGIGDDAR